MFCPVAILSKAENEEALNIKSRISYARRLGPNVKSSLFRHTWFSEDQINMAGDDLIFFHTLDTFHVPWTLMLALGKHTREYGMKNLHKNFHVNSESLINKLAK